MFVRCYQAWEYGSMQKIDKVECGRESKRKIAKGYEPDINTEML